MSNECVKFCEKSHTPGATFCRTLYVTDKSFLLLISYVDNLVQKIISCCLMVYWLTGYGNQIPRSTAGRLVSLPYAVVGIPLTFCFLSRFGRDLARGFLSVYRRVCCDVLCCQRCLRRRRRRIYSSGGRGVGHSRSPHVNYVENLTIGQWQKILVARNKIMQASGAVLRWGRVICPKYRPGPPNMMWNTVWPTGSQSIGINVQKAAFCGLQNTPMHFRRYSRLRRRRFLGDIAPQIFFFRTGPAQQ